MKHRLLAALLALLALSACRREPAQPAALIPRDRFVAANVALRAVPDSAPQAARDAALKKAGVTDRQLRAWVTAYAREPETLAKAWEEIAFKVDSIGGSRPMPQMPGGPPPPPAALGRPLPPPQRDSAGERRAISDSMLARRRRRAPPVRPGLQAEPVRVQ